MLPLSRKMVWDDKVNMGFDPYFLSKNEKRVWDDLVYNTCTNYFGTFYST